MALRTQAAGTCTVNTNKTYQRIRGFGGPQGGKYVLNSGAEAKYAEHLNSYVKYVESQGVNLYSISVQNEPDYSSDWTRWSTDRTTQFLANYGQAVEYLAPYLVSQGYQIVSVSEMFKAKGVEMKYGEVYNKLP